MAKNYSIILRILYVGTLFVAEVGSSQSCSGEATGEWGKVRSFFLQDQCCNSSKYDDKLLGVSNKDLKSSHRTEKMFHKSYNNYI